MQRIEHYPGLVGVQIFTLSEMIPVKEGDVVTFDGEDLKVAHADGSFHAVTIHNVVSRDVRCTLDRYPEPPRQF